MIGILVESILAGTDDIDDRLTFKNAHENPPQADFKKVITDLELISRRGSGTVPFM
jgi:hypothetical protein